VKFNQVRVSVQLGLARHYWFESRWPPHFDSELAKSPGPPASFLPGRPADECKARQPIKIHHDGFAFRRSRKRSIQVKKITAAAGKEEL
jgi:hypothetical protein